ncbi:UNVERIFIED_CONTAM: putative purple acid phosphatase 20 [Sesamum angustifolium]|uniref:Purple acid phosphatase n=1 Tax=Sesamum angustifolium TaxID=2727405 RepID=A0AAW2N843_9LAMI
MRISWTTLFPTPAIVYYGTSSGNYTLSAKGSSNVYHYLRYTSGEIHDVVIGPLNPNTLYYYRCGIKSSPDFTFKTPPPRFPINFAVVGDLGQTQRTSSTLEHIEKSNYDLLLLPGDLSYADMYQPRWDTFGHFVEPLASNRPWMVTEGNHERERIRGIYRKRFTSYNARWVMPYEECGSPSNLYYSFEVGGVHVLMLGSYANFEPGSDQYRWLQADLRRVDRRTTPWLIAVVHAPWYNSNEAQGEYVSLGMKKAMEDVLYRARVDVVFAGHVHAYERFVRVYKDQADQCGPVYITSGAGGNHEGLALRFLEPEPKISAFREANFGHGQFSVLNATHAVWTWHRNKEDIGVASDKVLLRSLAYVPTCQKSLAIDVCAAEYRRPPPRRSLSGLLFKQLDEIDPTSPQQVHISLSGENHMRISWITSDPTPPVVYYGTSPGASTSSANGTTNMYHYVTYRSGEIHDVVVGPLKPNTVYYYRCGLSSSPEFSFKTPPSLYPIKFSIIGDLGQTEWTSSTLDHIAKSNYDVLLLPGDLSYADVYQPSWDTFGQLVQPLASSRPWMVTQGNHEVEKIPAVHHESFTSYNARWVMPYKESGSSSNLYYSFEVAGVHVIMLGSYADFGPESDQYSWLQADLRKVDRSKTPWLIALIHAPWYNSNEAHQGEDESVGMKTAMEDLLYGARVDAIFAGHVHAYERFVRVHKNQADECGPVHITIGDGGNREGLATRFMDPQPRISAFREPSFGHGHLNIVNATHAVWTWHRNDEDVAVASDEVWLRSLASVSTCS